MTSPLLPTNQSNHLNTQLPVVPPQPQESPLLNPSRSFVSYFQCHDSNDGRNTALDQSHPLVPMDSLAGLDHVLFLLNNPENIKKEIIKNLWNSIFETEELLLNQLNILINKELTSYNNLSNLDNSGYKKFLKDFIDRFKECINKLESQQIDKSQLNIPKLMGRSPISPIVILLSLTNEQLASKELAHPLKQFLETYQNQFIKDLSSIGLSEGELNELISILFNSGFSKWTRPEELNPVQTLSHINALIRAGDIPSVKSIIGTYWSAFCLIKETEDQECRRKIAEAFLNLGYKIANDRYYNQQPHTFNNFSQFESVHVVWKSLTSGDVEHSIKEEEIIVYVDKSKIQQQKLALWIDAISNMFAHADTLHIPCDWVCSSSTELTRKRKREDHHLSDSKSLKLQPSSSAHSADRKSVTDDEGFEVEVKGVVRPSRTGPERDTLITLPQLYEQLLSILEDNMLHKIMANDILVVTGIPNKPWRESVFQKLFDQARSATIVLPIESLYSDDSEISSQFVSETKKANTKFCVSLSLENMNDTKLNKQIAYLNKLPLAKIIVKINSEQDFPFLFRIIVQTECAIKIDIKNCKHSEQFDFLRLAEDVYGAIDDSTDHFNIMMPLILAFPDRAGTMPALVNLLTRIDIRSRVKKEQFFNDYYLTNAQIEILFALVAKNKEEWIKYPDIVMTILNRFVDIQGDPRVERVDKFDENFEQFFRYLAENIENLRDCEALEQDHFVRWSFKMLDKLFDTQSPETDNKVRHFFFIADHFYTTEEAQDQQYAQMAFDLVKYGWIPPHNEYTLSYKHTLYLPLLPLLVKSISNPSELKNKWITTICNQLFPIYGISKSTEDDFIKLLNYNNYERKLDIVFVDAENLQSHKNLLYTIYYTLVRKREFVCNIDPSKYFSHLFKYITYVFSTREEKDEGKIFGSIIFTLQSNELEKHLQNEEGWQQIGDLLSKNIHFLNHLNFRRKILKKLVVFSKNPYKKKIYSISILIAGHLLFGSEKLDEETLKICARAIIHKGWPYVVYFDPNSINKAPFEQALWEEIKESGDECITIHPFVCNALWTLLQEKYNSNKEDYHDLVQRGMVVFRAILLLPMDDTNRPELLRSIIFAAETNKNDIKIFLKDIIEALFRTSEFRKNLKSFNVYSLAQVMEVLPNLNEESQKLFLHLFKSIQPTAVWITRHPVYYNELMTIFVDRPREYQRGIKLTLLSLDCPQADASKIEKVMKSLAPLSQEEFCSLISKNPKLIKCLGRDLTDEELRLVEFGKYEVNLGHMELARPFVEKPCCPTVSSTSFLDLNPLLSIVNQLTFDKPGILNYLDPGSLVIDKKLITPQFFMENIIRMVRTIQNREKIVGAPEDAVEREKRYAELHMYTAHIVHILAQKEISTCTGLLLFFADIGPYCFTQYQELPKLYHSLLGQLEVPVVPWWMSMPNGAELLDSSMDLEFEVPGFLSVTDLMKQLRTLVAGIANKQVAFKEPLQSSELDYAYSILNQKMNVILYLAHIVPLECRGYVLAQFASLDLQSARKSIEELRALEDTISTVWLICYLQHTGVDAANLVQWISSIVKQELQGHASPYSNSVKKILCGYYNLSNQAIGNALAKLNEMVKNPENLPAGLSELARTVASQTTFHEPKHLEDKLIILLHQYRWKLLFDELATLPISLTENIHNGKFIEMTVSESMKLYFANSGQNQYEDIFVYPEARSVVHDIKAKVYWRYSVPSFIMLKIKAALLNSDPNNTISSEELDNWLNDNVPDGMTLEQVRNDLYDDDYKIKDKWLIYLLEKTRIIQIKNKG